MAVYRMTRWIAAVLVIATSAGAQEHHHMDSADSSSHSWRTMVGASAIGVWTCSMPGPFGKTYQETVVTQPVVMGKVSSPGGSAFGSLMLDFEGLTLSHGELNTGAFGEGYFDRRHPHTYLHEAIVGIRERVARTDFSISAGKGFAPFGSDDPMVRSFVAFPVNHHLSQVLERVLVAAAARRGPVAVELGTFNGDEPVSPGSVPNFRRFGDSWSTRVTIDPRLGTELSASYASVKSPEFHGGGGLDQRKWHASARAEFPNSAARRCDCSSRVLIEWARTSDLEDGAEVFVWSSLLAESVSSYRSTDLAIRLERSDRPEEKRTSDPFRSPRPPVDLGIEGMTRWSSMSAQLAHTFRGRDHFTITPLVELEVMQPRALFPNAIFRPSVFYGRSTLSMLSIGARLAVGHSHTRMGRYGSASEPPVS